MGHALIYIVNAVLDLLQLAVIIQAVLSWLIAFNVINLHNDFVRQIARFLDAIVNPLLRPFRRIIPSLGGVDITPILLLIALKAVQIAFNALLALPLIGLLG